MKKQGSWKLRCDNSARGEAPGKLHKSGPNDAMKCGRTQPLSATVFLPFLPTATL